MNSINYDKQMQEQIKILQNKGEKPKLLLHTCCAPCASGSIEKILNAFDITMYFYNPNMDGAEEFLKRNDECVRLADYFNVKFVSEPYDHSEFLSFASSMSQAEEGGLRCRNCFSLRLKKTLCYAENNRFDYFATTLTLSPLKNAELINGIGFELAKNSFVKYLATDFKKRGGYIRSIELSKELSLYRQNFCGCEFSKNR